MNTRRKQKVLKFGRFSKALKWLMSWSAQEIAKKEVIEYEKYTSRSSLINLGIIIAIKAKHEINRERKQIFQLPSQ